MPGPECKAKSAATGQMAAAQALAILMPCMGIARLTPGRCNHAGNPVDALVGWIDERGTRTGRTVARFV